MANNDSGAELELVVKNPAARRDFALHVPVGATLDDVKRLLAERYDGRPAPAAQTVSTFFLRALEDRLACAGLWCFFLERTADLGL
jgi:hypothetical protein